MPNTCEGSTVISTSGIIVSSRLIAVTFLGRNEFVDMEAVLTDIPAIWRPDPFQIDLDTQRTSCRLVEDDLSSNVEMLPVSLQAVVGFHITKRLKLRRFRFGYHRLAGNTSNVNSKSLAVVICSWGSRK